MKELKEGKVRNMGLKDRPKSPRPDVKPIALKPKG
jgi:hypothetical protein